MKGQGVIEFSLVTFGAVVLLLVALALLANAAVPDIPDHLDGLPMTDHAMNKHWDEPLNAGNLPGMWDGDQCIRKSVAYCPKEEKLKLMCEVKPGEWGGIVISVSNPEQPVIVTAFQGQEAYWMGNIKGCIPIVLP